MNPLVERWLEHDLDEADSEALRLLLETDPSVRAELVAAVRERHLFAATAHQVQAARDTVGMEEADGTALPAEPRHPSRRKRPSHGRRAIPWPWLAGAAVAAAAGLVIMLRWSPAPPSDALPIAADATGQGPTIVRADGGRDAVGPLRAGDELVAERAGRLALRDEATVLELAAGSRLRLDDAAQGWSFSLRQGTVDVQAAPQRAGRQGRIATDLGVATVVGTRFQVALVDGITRLSVGEGSVRFHGFDQDRQAGPERLVEAGRFTVAGPVLPEGIWTQHTGERLLNGDAAQGLRHWYVAKTDLGSIAVVPTGGVEGGPWWRMEGAPRLEQRIPTVAGVRYRCTAHLRIDRITVPRTWGGVRILAVDDRQADRWRELAVGDPLIMTTDGWRTVELPFTAVGAASRIIVEVFSDGRYAAGADAVSVVPVDAEPDR